MKTVRNVETVDAPRDPAEPMPMWVLQEDPRAGKAVMAKRFSEARKPWPGYRSGPGVFVRSFRRRGGKSRMVEVCLFGWGLRFYPDEPKFIRVEDRPAVQPEERRKTRRGRSPAITL